MILQQAKNKLGNPSELTLAEIGGLYFWIGLLLLAALLTQQIIHWRWPWLAGLQADNVYKQLSGFALFGFIIHQWRFSVQRAQGNVSKARLMFDRHKMFCAMAPLLFFMHSQSLGYALTSLLSLTYFWVFLSGLFNGEIIKVRKPFFRPLWITLHVGLSMGLLLLLAYHIYISYAFK